MAFTIASAPHGHSTKSTPALMRWVCIALIPGLVAQVWFFGAGVLVQLLLAIPTSLCCEALILRLRSRAIGSTLRDSSAVLTAALIAVSLPPLAPWWMVVLGTAFAIIIAKQLYGGLGHNPFNPAMVAYVLLLVSFPGHMTAWQPALGIAHAQPDFVGAVQAILGRDMGHWRDTIDGITSATPLDSMRTQLSMGRTVDVIRHQAPFGDTAGIGWMWVNIGFLIGGLLMILLGVIAWQIPTAMILTLAACAAISHGLQPQQFMPASLHLLSGATMLGAFFIATDPVTASTTPRGRLIYGALIGLLVFIIRAFGGYPDAVAFSVLLVNILVPLIDSYSRPRIYGQSRR